MPYRPDLDDPFYGGEKTPSLSWKGLPVGSTFTLTILDEAKLLQTHDFDTGQLAYWDPAQTRPKMAAVLNVRVTDGPHSVGEERSIWAKIPSSMFLALKDAQRLADAKFLPGGTLRVRFDGEVPHENKRFHAIKQYKATYTPPVQAPQRDPFADMAPATPSPTRPQGMSRPQPVDSGQVPRF